MTLWNQLKEKMQLYPSQKICEEKAEMTYDEVIMFSEIFAQNLSGIKCCAIFCNSEMAAALALLSCFAAQITALPLSMRYGQIHCNKILDMVSPDAMITDIDGELKVYRIKESRYAIPSEKPALIMCTSGTKGIPKGAMLGEKNIIANVTDISSYFDIDKNDTILISRPLYHCAVLSGEFIVSLLKGLNIRFYSGRFNPAKMLEMIQNYDITTFCGTPTLLFMMSKLIRNSDECKLRHIVISGECMSRHTGICISHVFQGSEIYHVYGLTEAGPRVCYLPPKLFDEYTDFVGIPLDSVSVKILNTDKKECLPNEEGILWIKGDNVMLGYYNDPERTEEVLQNGWLCTGDIAIRNNVGLIKIKGRNDDLIIKSGMNIYPAEIEAAIKTDKRVREVLLYGIDTRFGKQIGMKIVGDFKSTDEVRSLCAATLPEFQIPTSIELLPELPKNGSGKIRRDVHA